MIKNIRHTGIVVKDLETSLYFYQDLLGFKITEQRAESGDYIDSILVLDGVKVTTLKMVAPDGQMIELLNFLSHPKRLKTHEIIDIGITHIAFTVDNLEKVYSDLSDQGIQFNAPPQFSPDGNAKVTFCKAPEGTFIELVEVLHN